MSERDRQFGRRRASETLRRARRVLQLLALAESTTFPAEAAVALRLVTKSVRILNHDGTSCRQ